MMKPKEFMNKGDIFFGFIRLYSYSMKILVYGHGGWIGQQFTKLLSDHDYVCGNARVDNEIELHDEITSVSPTHVVSFIGRTHGEINGKVFTTIDYLEQEGKLVENMRDNLYSPIVLAEICRKYGIHYTYLGTGCIFKYDDDHPFGLEENGFAEDARPNFFGSSYSIVKGFTDRLMGFYSDSVLNLRIRMPITGSKNGRNFITKITSYEKICSVPNSMTVLPEMLPYVLEMMTKNVTGTINLVNPGLISHNEILEMYREIVDPSFTWKNFTQEEQRAILAADRSNNFLDTTKLEEMFPGVKNIKASVRECLMEYSQTFVKEVNLLVTGGCGFIGSNFINHYFPKQKMNTLTNIDAMYYCASETNVDELIRESNNYELVKGNLCDREMIRRVLTNRRITHVIHFAAQSHVQNSFESSINFTNDNILGTHNLLEECRKYGKIERFIHVSTDEVYGESMLDVDEQHKTEHSILCPTNPYAATKAGAELIAQSYAHSFKMPIIITRGNNVYGPNQYPEKLIPLFIKQLREGKKVTIQGDGSTVRAFLHVEDTAAAFECILERGVIGEIYNIGCDEGMEYSVLEVAKLLISRIKNSTDYDSFIEYIEDRPYNDKRYYISNQKLKDLGWEIKVGFEEGIRLLTDDSLIKIKQRLLNLIDNDDVIKYFGDWVNHTNELSSLFVNAQPFPNIILRNFLDGAYAEMIFNDFPMDIENDKWHKYYNPIEVKFARDDINNLSDPIRNIFYMLSSDAMIKKMCELTKINNLECDEYLHGAGLHIHPRRGRLNLHLDYEKHPITGKKRRLNIILYMSKDWNDDWHGQTELWDRDVQTCLKTSRVEFNTAIVFVTDETSWHGVPEPINCPEDVYRKTIAYYYVSEFESNELVNIGNDGSGHRLRATFVKRPSDPYNEKIEQLYKIRPFRRIESEDMKLIYPEWYVETDKLD